MTVTQWPEWYVYMQDNKERNIRGWKGDPPDNQGTFIATPNCDGTFLISTKKWPNRYVYMKDNKSGNVRGWEGDPGPQGHWHFTVKDVTKHTVVLTTAKWQGWYMYMRGDDDGSVRGWKGDPGEQGHFIVEYM